MYKLCMLGVPIEGPMRAMCDNDAVVKRRSFADTALNKRHCSNCNHKVQGVSSYCKVTNLL